MVFIVNLVLYLVFTLAQVFTKYVVFFNKLLNVLDSLTSMAFLITAMCRNGAALRFDVLRNSYNACEGLV